MLRKCRELSVCFSFLLACSSVPGEEWTQFRGSDYGRTSETQVNELWDSSTVAWKTPLPGRGASSPVLFGENIYLTAYTGYGTTHENPGSESDLQRHLFCIAAADGSVVWKNAVPTTSPKNPYNSWGVGKHGFASSSVAIDKTGIYVFYGATGALAFDHAGKELWRTDCGKGVHPYGTGNSPVLYKDTVIINASVECGDLIALNKSDGSVVWRQSGIDQSWSTPVIYQSPGGSTELALSAKGKILAFNPDSGEPIWNCEGIGDYICPSITVQGGILYAIGGRSNKTIAVKSGGKGDVTQSHIVWQLSKGSNVCSPVYHDGHLYWSKEQNGVLYCVDVKSGKIVYEKRLSPESGLIYASPLLASGRLYYVSREKGIYVVAAKPQFELLSHTTIAGDDSIFNASPVPLPGGAVLLRSDKFLYRMKPAN